MSIILYLKISNSHIPSPFSEIPWQLRCVPQVLPTQNYPAGQAAGKRLGITGDGDGASVLLPQPAGQQDWPSLIGALEPNSWDFWENFHEDFKPGAGILGIKDWDDLTGQPRNYEKFPDHMIDSPVG